MTLALIHHHDDNQDVDDDMIWYDYPDDDQYHDDLHYHTDIHGYSWYEHLNIRNGGDMVIIIMIIMIISIIIQGACESTNLSSLGSWSTVTHSHKSHWHSNYQVEIYENNGTPENEYVKVQKSSFSKGLWWHWDEPKIANDHHDCKQFVHWAQVLIEWFR